MKHDENPRVSRHWPVRSESENMHAALTESAERNNWTGYFGRCILRAGIILFAKFGLAVLIPLAASLFK